MALKSEATAKTVTKFEQALQRDLDEKRLFRRMEVILNLTLDNFDAKAIRSARKRANVSRHLLNKFQCDLQLVDIPKLGNFCNHLPTDFGDLIRSAKDVLPNDPESLRQYLDAFQQKARSYIEDSARKDFGLDDFDAK